MTIPLSLLIITLSYLGLFFEFSFVKGYEIPYKKCNILFNSVIPHIQWTIQRLESLINDIPKFYNDNLTKKILPDFNSPHTSRESHLQNEHPTKLWITADKPIKTK